MTRSHRLDPEQALMASEARRARPLRREPDHPAKVAFLTAHALMVQALGEREAYCITARLAHLNPSRDQGVDRRTAAEAKFREVVA